MAKSFPSKTIKEKLRKHILDSITDMDSIINTNDEGDRVGDAVFEVIGPDSGPIIISVRDARGLRFFTINVKETY